MKSSPPDTEALAVGLTSDKTEALSERRRLLLMPDRITLLGLLPTGPLANVGASALFGETECWISGSSAATCVSGNSERVFPMTPSSRNAPAALTLSKFSSFSPAITPPTGFASSATASPSWAATASGCTARRGVLCSAGSEAILVVGKCHCSCPSRLRFVVCTARQHHRDLFCLLSRARSV